MNDRAVSLEAVLRIVKARHDEPDLTLVKDALFTVHQAIAALPAAQGEPGDAARIHRWATTVEDEDVSSLNEPERSYARGWNQGYAAARRWVAEVGFSATPSAPAAQGEPDTRFEAAVKATWKMIDPLAPPGAPGSYARGHYNGIVDALRQLRTNYDAALPAAQPALDLERAFQMLEANGVPRERARTVANGIGVLVTRLSREIHALRAAQPVAQGEPVVDDLAMLVRRLAHKVKNLIPDNILAEGALGYLRRHGLEGSPLRAAPPADAQPAAQREPVAHVNESGLGIVIVADRPLLPGMALYGAQPAAQGHAPNCRALHVNEAECNCGFAAPAAQPAAQGELHIVFDGPPGPEAGRFVEVETPDGRSVSVGRWEQRGDFWHLILDAPSADPMRCPKAQVSEDGITFCADLNKAIEIEALKEFARSQQARDLTTIKDLNTRLEETLTLLRDVEKMCRKVDLAGHHIVCNYQTDQMDWCNCGVTNARKLLPRIHALLAKEGT